MFARSSVGKSLARAGAPDQSDGRPTRKRSDLWNGGKPASIADISRLRRNFLVILFAHESGCFRVSFLKKFVKIFLCMREKEGVIVIFFQAFKSIFFWYKVVHYVAAFITSK